VLFANDDDDPSIYMQDMRKTTRGLSQESRCAAEILTEDFPNSSQKHYSFRPIARPDYCNGKHFLAKSAYIRREGDGIQEHAEREIRRVVPPTIHGATSRGLNEVSLVLL
jgi:hypothetical protein